MNIAPRYSRPDTLGAATHASPIRNRRHFVDDDIWVRYDVEVSGDGGGESSARRDADAATDASLLFEKAGPRELLFFEPGTVKAAIVTCGGLAPGLNNVIRSLVTELHFHYGTRTILGIPNGYRGLNPAEKLTPIELTPDMVDNIHTEGGTILGTSRGMQDQYVMLEYLKALGVNLLFCIGGDGTLRAAAKIAAAAAERSEKIAVIGVPKTIDNDVYYCDRTFGYSTAVDAARDVLTVAHVEAKGAERGLGLVKLMGRDAGFIACGATVSSQQVNYTLIPEVPFQLDGPRGLLAELERRMDARKHALIAVAEGAGQDLFPPEERGTDASGNTRYGDIGHLLRDRIAQYFRDIGKPVDMKYINPSYTIRGVPANSEDSLLCDRLARDAVHAAMAGKTSCQVSFLNNRVVHVPLSLAVGRTKQVDVDGPLWQAVLASTGQPVFRD